MSKRHIFESHEGLVNRSLKGFVAYNPSLALIDDMRVVYDTTYDKNQVAILSGGGSGHEPAWAGYVGKNMLTASVSGDIFASPSTKQILAGVQAVPSTKGSILVVTNYTGDCLHFGLAAEKTNALGGAPCKMIICGDDVSIGRTKGNLVGRRGLAGQIGVLKVMGGASGAGGSLDEVYNLGVAFSQQIVSIAATLDHCHVPGRAEHATLAEDEVEIGTGPHNEPGYKKISPQPTAASLVGTILDYCLRENDPDRSYVKFNSGDEAALLVSNFGGISYLEMGAVVDELLNQLAATYKIEPTRVYFGQLETSLNAPAFSTSVINLSQAAKNCSYSLEQIKGFLDVRTTTHWESAAGFQSTQRKRAEQIVKSAPEPEKKLDAATDLAVEPKLLESALRSACNAVIEREPDLTKWDTVMGDGDCGETLKTGATSLLEALDHGLAQKGSCVAVLHELEDIVESKMGGTLGGILGIFFVSLTNALQAHVALSKSEGDVKRWAAAVHQALTNLRQYTPAAVGDRTVMDVFIPFADALQKTGSFAAGVDEAVRAAEETKKMTPKLGRATYVGGKDTGELLPPDPGAWGIMEAIRGLKNGM
ncbi:hypothetical protein FH972_024448 [Carpinus fangiana]|uniref:Dihydroxyacetone kinase n=1 Tax=Carpinus fangiana TaxID=176857 RepID=A0A5N6KYJ9_9ROSI|nr:hypothetical protein FH972_024448 [Carpinus fangiana]